MKTKSLTEAAVLSALLVVSSITAIYTGIAYTMYLDMVVPIFICLTYIRLGYKYTILTSITSLLIVSLAIGDIPSAIWMTQGIIMGLICGYFIIRKGTIFDDFFYSAICGCFIMVLIDIYFSKLTGYSFIKDFDSYKVLFPTVDEKQMEILFSILVASLPISTILVVYIGTLFIGKKLNEKVVFNPYKACDGDVTRLASMLNIDKEKAAEVKADFEMSIAEIIVVKPAELNEEYYKNIFGPDKVKTEEEYFEAIKQMISAQISGNSDMLFRMQAEKQLVEEFGNFELPQEFLKKWLVRRNEGLTAENIDEEFEKMIPSLKWQLIKERIAVDTEVKIEEADVTNHAKAIARQQFAQYGMTNVEDDMLADYAKRILEDKNTRSRIVEEAGDAKLFEAIKQTAKIEAKGVSVEEFKAIAEKA